MSSPTATSEAKYEVLIVGEGNYSYSKALIGLHPDWYITASDYGDGSNTQQLVQTYGKAIKLTNVDALRLGSGSITGSNKYDVIVFNAPRAVAGPFYEASASLVDNVLSSAGAVLKPGGQVRFSGAPAYPASPRLEQLTRNRPTGYTSAYSIPFLSDSDYGLPYNAQRLNGQSLDADFTKWNWYIFVK